MADTPPTPSIDQEAWERIGALVDAQDAPRLLDFLEALPPADTAYTITHVDEDRRTAMLSLLSEADPGFAADLLEHFDDAQAADMIEEMIPAEAAAIVDEMDSDEQTDVLAEVEDDAAEAILQNMDPEEAADTRDRLRYEEDTAGGLMITEFLVYPEEKSIRGVTKDLRKNGEKYNSYEVRYLYTVDSEERLTGVVPMRGLLLADRDQPLGTLKVEDPMTVHVADHLNDIEDLFDRIDYTALPVVDNSDRLLGVVQRAAVQEAASEEAKEDLAKVGGIIGGEELRSMPLMSRALRRMAFLLPIAGLLLVSASVIHLFVGTVEKIPVLAAFLPVVAGVCGSGGGQAVAVSMREISLGLIKPSDFGMLLVKEAGVALFNGLVLGLILCVVAGVWEGNAYLGLVIGGSIPIVLLVAKCVGGTVPVILQKVGLDPAMASGPIVTTIVDLIGFFVVLAFATLMIDSLV